MTNTITISNRDPSILKLLEYIHNLESSTYKYNKIILDFNNIRFISISCLVLLNSYLLDKKLKGKEMRNF